MIEIDKMEDNVYVVKSKKDGNEFTVQFHSISDLADYIEQEDSNIVGVWKVQVVKLPPEIYTRRTT